MGVVIENNGLTTGPGPGNNPERSRLDLIGGTGISLAFAEHGRDELGITLSFNQFLNTGVFIGDATGVGNSPALSIRQDYTATPASGTNQNTLQVKALAKGAWSTSHMLYNVQSMVADAASVSADKTVTGAANNGSGLIRLTVTGHGYSTGDRIIADSVGGTVEANNSWLVTVVDANTLDLQGSTFTNAYTSGGITTNRPGYHAFLGVVSPVVNRGGLASTPNIHADDIGGFFMSNNGSAKASDAFYVGRNTGMSTIEWDNGFSCDAMVDYGLRLGNTQSGHVLATGYGASVTPDFQSRRARGTKEVPRRTKASDVIGRFSGAGAGAVDDATDALFANPTGRMDVLASEDHTASAKGTDIRFYTTPVGSTTIAERFRIQASEGLDFNQGTFSTYCIRLKNNTPITSRNNAGGANVDILKLNTSDQLEIAGAVKLIGTSVGFYNTAPGTKQTVTGSRAANAALASLLTALATVGLITDSSSA